MRLVHGGHVGWVSLNVSRSVGAWLRSSPDAGPTRLGLRVVVSDARSRAPVDPAGVFHAPAPCSADHQPGTGSVSQHFFYPARPPRRRFSPRDAMHPRY